MDDEEGRRSLGPEMTAEGWRVLSGDDLMWIHAPSHRCITVSAAPRRQCRVPCWGPEPADPETPGWFFACRVHDDLGNPMFGDAFWVESYAIAVRIARRTRLDILAETPAQARARRGETERRGEDWWRDLVTFSAEPEP